MSHYHMRADRGNMRASREEAKQFVATCNASPHRKNPSRLVLRDSQIITTCLDCGQPLVVVDVDFTDKKPCWMRV